MEKIHSIDCMRAIAAFLVVCIHIPFYGAAGNIAIAYGKTAVPFFLIVCGYFCYRTESEEFTGRLKKQIRKIALLTILANILFMIFDIVLQFIFSSNPAGDISQMFTLKKWFDFAVYNQSPFADHLWYLGSLLYALIIVLFLCRLRLHKYLMILSPVLLLCYIVALRSGGEMIVWRNCLMVSVPYFMFGCIIRKYEPRFLPRLNKFILPILICILLITNLIELSVYKTSAPPFISAELLVIAAVLFLIKHPAIGKNSFLEKIGREYSLFIYIFHMSLVLLIYKWYESGHMPNSFPYYAPIAVYIASLAAAVIYKAAKNCIFGKAQNALNKQLQQ
ncbi:MAG TPA: acyltransferase [Ruminiclostridium sp.]|nr:acyltransferase [Ruminiclostridium sp.]